MMRQKGFYEQVCLDHPRKTCQLFASPPTIQYSISFLWMRTRCYAVANHEATACIAQPTRPAWAVTREGEWQVDEADTE